MIGDSNGSPVYETPTPQSNYDLHYASDNYLYVAYSDMRNFIDSDIYIQKYSEEWLPQLSDVLVVDNFLADDNIKFITELNNSQLLIGFDSGSFLGTRSMVLSIENDGSLTDGAFGISMPSSVLTNVAFNEQAMMMLDVSMKAVGAGASSSTALVEVAC